MKSSFCIDLQRFMLIPTKFPLSPKIFDINDSYIKKYAATHHEPQRKSLCLTKNPFQNQTVISRFPLFPVKQSIKSTLNLITKNLNLLLLT